MLRLTLEVVDRIVTWLPARVAYAIAGVLFVFAAVNYDPEKARGLDAALKTLAGYSWGVWLLVLIAAGIAAFGVYCIAQAKYRKI